MEKIVNETKNAMSSRLLNSYCRRRNKEERLQEKQNELDKLVEELKKGGDISTEQIVKVICEESKEF